jgi:Putative adhesin
MSNPVMTPGVPPVAPLPPRRRSYAGPFVLIVLGTVCLLGTMRIVSLSRLAHLFANYWPVLLILWGVIKLIEHMQAQREGTRASGIGAGGIFLVIMIVVFGLISTQLEHVNWSGLRENINLDDDDISNLFGESYNFNDHLDQDFPAGASLKVIDNHGAVSVHAADDNKITVIVRKRVGAENQSDADKYNGETKPTITSIGGLVTLDAKVEGAGDHAVETDLDISLPRKVAVSIISRRGDVSLSGRDGNVDVSSQHYDTTIEDVNGNVKVSQEKGSVRVEQITGDVHVEGRVNEVSVADVKGGVQLDGEFQESIKLARITKTVTFKSSRTDMEFSRIDGSLDLDSDELHAEEITGPLHLTTRSKNIRLNDVSGDVRLQNDNGAIEVVMRALGNVQIDSKNGDIQLSLPEKAGFRLDAHTRDGEIQSDFAEVKVNNDEHESKASGSVGNASSHIVLNNEHDGIEIRKAPVDGGPKEGVHGGVTGGVPGAKQSKPGKNLPAPKEKVEPTEN